MNNSFIDLIKDIKRDDSLKNVERNYQICINHLKDLEKKKQNDKIFPFNNVIKEKSYILLRLLYLQMFGKKIDKEHNFSVIEILTCNKYILKRRAFLFLNNVNDNEDVIFLLINLYKKELHKENISNTPLGTKTRVLNSLTNISTSIIKDNLTMLANTYSNYGNNVTHSNTGPRNSPSNVASGSNFVAKENGASHFQFSNNIEKYYKIINTTLILNSISNICTDIMSNNLYNDIFMLLNSSFMYVRKKSIISFYRLVICNLDILHIFFDFIKKNFILLYNNECPSYDTLHNEEPGYVLKNNTSLCCLIINILAEIFCTLEKQQEKKNAHKNASSSINADTEINYQTDKKEKKYSSEFIQNNEHTHNDKSQQNSPMYLKKYLSFIPFIYNILNDRLHLIDNWRLIKIIKFINKLTKYENRIYKKFLSIIIHIFYTNKAQSVVYECFEFILFNYKNTYDLDINLEKYISVNEKNLNKQENNAKMSQNILNRQEDNEGRHKQITGLNKSENLNKESGSVQNGSDTLLCYCFSHLLKYLYSDDKNIVYVCTKLYRSIFEVPDLYNLFVKYNSIQEFSRHIFNNFEHKDITLRNNLLYILYFLINKNNFENIIYNILAYIYKNNDQEYLDEYINVILNYGENNLKNLNNINLYIFILFYILCLKNHGTNIKILDQIRKINVHLSTTHISTNFLSSLFIITYGNFLISAILIRKEIEDSSLSIDSIENSAKHNLSIPLVNEKAVKETSSENKLDSYNKEIHEDSPNLSNNTIHNFNNSVTVEKGTLTNGSIYNLNETIENEVDYFFNNHNESLEKYDLFEYIISILKMEDKISYSKENTSRYTDINNMNIKCFEYLINFISIYIEETYKEIKEFKSDIFLNIFFFSLYLFFIKFSTSSILWNVTKIFIFFSQYENYSNLSFLYLSKIERYIDYLIFKQNDIQNLDRSLILKHVLALVNSKQTTDTSIFYNYFNTKIEVENIETSFNYSIPFKYNDSFFLQTNKQNPDQPSNLQAVDKSHKTSKPPTTDNELDALIDKAKKCSTILRESNLLFLVHINNHFKLYYHITQDNILHIYIDCFKETNINNFVLSLSANVIEYKTNSNEGGKFKLVQNQESYFYKFNQNYLDEKVQDIDHTQSEDNPNQSIDRNKKITKNEIKIADNITDNLTMSIKFSTQLTYIKLMLNYSCNMENYEIPNITLPYFPMAPLVLSVDEFKKVDKKKGKFRNMIHEISLEIEKDVREVVFNYFVFLSEHINMFFFNIKNAYLNLKKNNDISDLRIILCTKRVDNQDGLILLINIHHTKIEYAKDGNSKREDKLDDTTKREDQLDQSKTHLIPYQIDVQINLLNSSQEEDDLFIDYLNYYLAALFSKKINIDNLIS
ncbi:AP-3 complex subunit delta, putative [Plasmodium chabaudi chabaudi]|uniref:AP-3 complex subunit delta, putative n=1 Tax=Plasmodium chabaudi chabaudi TaxID=31271 RepID=A0A4V0KBK8_PLACU|nr:AP-3 complex subunit delta, putative [Plasmodium chabaudi chabaudi]VTZ69704.1 AP-3 complex subunit delta, putative [Plasmodium chabaudi chabaudi]|eukprot:XP_016654263.1 AP-3 complex subunit delta, putative [Plasmodium chabaudi chabaudi]